MNHREDVVGLDDFDQEVDSIVVGYVEAINESGIYGWAYDPRKPSESIQLSLYLDGKYIQRFNCAHRRQDVVAAGHPRAEVGFYVQIPSEYCDGRDRTFYFTANGRLVLLGSPDGSHVARRTLNLHTFFDGMFYRNYYKDCHATDNREAFEQWIREGRNAGRHPNAERLLDGLRTNGQELPADFSAIIYRFLNNDLYGHADSDWEAAVHYLTWGKSEGRAYNLPRPSFVGELYFGGRLPSSVELDKLNEGSGASIYVSLDHLLRQNGITSDAFIKYLNVSDYVTDNSDAHLRTKLQCVRHFAESGRPACRPLSFESYFDHDFVSELDDCYGNLSAPEAYLRWINTGISNGLVPNASVFLGQLGLSNVGCFPSGFDPGAYLDRNPDIRNVTPNRWGALRHFIEIGAAEGRAGCAITSQNCDLYRAAADKMIVCSRFDAAKKLYESILLQESNNVLATRHYANCLLRLKEWYLASQICNRAIEQGIDNVGTYLNLTTCYSALGRWQEACEAMGRVTELRPGDCNLQRKYQEVLQQAHTALLHEANWFAAHRHYHQGVDLARTAAGLISRGLPTAQVTPAVSPIRFVLLIADLSLPQCKFYRVDQKIEQLHTAGIRCKMVGHLTDIVRAIRESRSLDAVILYRVPASPQVMWALSLLRKARTPVFFEIDDLIFDDSHFPDAFESYGGLITHDLYATLVLGTVAFAASMRACDYAIASTPALAEAMEPHVISGRAFLHRNALGSAHELGCAQVPVRIQESERVRIFYGTGTKAHNEDFDLHLAPSLAELLSKWGNKLELVIVGYLSLPDTLQAYRSQITLHEPIWDRWAYWNLLAEMDISVAVLKPRIAADCKSEIKWLEAAMLGVPSVVTATRTYTEVIEHGRTGFLVHEDQDWLSYLDRLIGNPTLRHTVGEAARQEALNRYSLDRMAKNIGAIFNAIAPETQCRRKKRVLIVHVFFAPQAIGGATRVVIDNVRDILARHSEEIEFQVFCTLEGGAEPYLPLVYDFEGVRVTAIPTPVDRKIDRNAWDDTMAKLFHSVVENFEPDLVHFHCIQRITVSACDVLRHKRIPYIVTVHDGWWISDEQFLLDEFGTPTRYDYHDFSGECQPTANSRLETKWLKHEALSGAEQILTVSEPFAQIYRECGFENVRVVSNGVSDLSVQPHRYASSDRVRLAYVGGLSLHKGYNLIRAALFHGTFSNLELLVIDHAMDSAEERRAVWGTTPVRFRGKYPQANVGELYRDVDILLAPSVWPESYGLAVREAMLSGCRVVVSDRGAVGQDVVPEWGWVIDVNSTEALTRVLKEIDATPEKFRSPPSAEVDLRRAAEQAQELVQIYLNPLPKGRRNENSALGFC